MRTILGLALTIAVVSGASAADLDYGDYEPDVVYMDEVYAPAPPRYVVRNKRIPCVTCRGARLPYGGLRKTYEATLPWGGLPEDCPPEFATSQTILVQKY